MSAPYLIPFFLISIGALGANWNQLSKRIKSRRIGKDIEMQTVVNAEIQSVVNQNHIFTSVKEKKLLPPARPPPPAKTRVDVKEKKLLPPARPPPPAKTRVDVLLMDKEIEFSRANVSDFESNDLVSLCGTIVNSTSNLANGVKITPQLHFVEKDDDDCNHTAASVKVEKLTPPARRPPPAKTRIDVLSKDKEIEFSRANVSDFKSNDSVSLCGTIVNSMTNLSNGDKITPQSHFDENDDDDCDHTAVSVEEKKLSPPARSLSPAKMRIDELLMDNKIEFSRVNMSDFKSNDSMCLCGTIDNSTIKLANEDKITPQSHFDENDDDDCDHTVVSVKEKKLTLPASPLPPYFVSTSELINEVVIALHQRSDKDDGKCHENVGEIDEPSMDKEIEFPRADICDVESVTNLKSHDLRSLDGSPNLTFENDCDVRNDSTTNSSVKYNLRS